MTKIPDKGGGRAETLCPHNEGERVCAWSATLKFCVRHLLPRSNFLCNHCHLSRPPQACAIHLHLDLCGEQLRQGACKGEKLPFLTFD